MENGEDIGKADDGSSLKVHLAILAILVISMAVPFLRDNGRLELPLANVHTHTSNHTTPSPFPDHPRNIPPSPSLAQSTNPRSPT